MASSAQRASDRLAGGEKSKILGEEARRKRCEKRLRQLEQDNVQSDPHADIIVNKALPKFADELKPDKKPTTSSTTSSPLFELATKKGKKMRLELTRTRFRKSFAQLTEEQYKLKDEDPSVRTYSEVRVKRSVVPARKFCSVCGFFSSYSCVECGMRFCCLRCRSIHKDTRCLKWTS